MHSEASEIFEIKLFAKLLQKTLNVWLAYEYAPNIVVFVLFIFRITNPPGGKSNINFIFGDDSQPAQSNSSVNRCQEERMRSNIFATHNNERNPTTITEQLSNPTSPNKTKSSLADSSPQKSSLDKLELYSAGWGRPEKISHKRPHPLSIRNKESHIF